ncbi:MAG: group 1 glycosyl transferase [Osedax symbiont Rs2]|nr:MAG: group 1 glycosyl transferase [Osedax symbiont Rs2]
MKVLIVHNRYLTKNIGGEDIVFENELSLLRDKLGIDNVYSYEVSNDNINKFFLLFSIWFSFKHFFLIKQIVKNESIDVVHVHNFYPSLTPSVFLAAKRAGAKVVHTLHNYRFWCISGILYLDNSGICERCVKKRFPLSGIFNRCYRHNYFQSFLAQLTFQFYKLTGAFNSIDCFFVLTSFQKNKVLSFGLPVEKVILKHNCIDVVRMPNVSKSGYIFVGRLEKSKGILVLLDVWSKLDNNLVLTIVGGGELEKELRERYSQNNIIFLGKCSREVTQDLISKSKYLIQPSLLFETFGLTIIEAMSLRTPVIGFEIGTRTDFIKHKENGFLCNPGSLSKTIIESYDYSHYGLMSENAYHKSLLFSDTTVISQQVSIYRSLIG